MLHACIEHYYRPTIVLTQSGEYVSGSARSVPGFNLYEAIHACRDHLLGYGGHFAAAGMTLELEQVDALRDKFEEVVASTIPPDLLIPEIFIDAEIGLKDIKWPFYNILCQMEPFGPENLRPIFIARRVMDTGYSRIVKNGTFVSQCDRMIPLSQALVLEWRKNWRSCNCGSQST